MNKTCFKCGEEKPIAEFYKHSQMADGYLGKCKECAKSDVLANRKLRVDYYREYDRKRGSRQSPEYSREYRQRFPEKYRATNMVNNAIRDGRMKKENKCSKCGSEKNVHAHHADYSYPLSVRWLCAACHSQLHHANKEGKNAF